MQDRPGARGPVALPRRVRRLRAAGYGWAEPAPAALAVAELLAAAEYIVNSAAPDILNEFHKPKRRFGKRKKRK